MVKHYPVMLYEVLKALSPKDGGVYVDGTFGNGGYTSAILNAANCQVYAIDRDKNVQVRANEIKDKYGERFTFLHGCFGDIKTILPVDKVDGFVIDIGVSSMQIDEANRGFSFQKDGTLDMRMDNSSGISAADIVNTYDEEALADLIYKYGDERKSRHIAHKIVEMRANKPFERTLELAKVVRSVVRKTPKDKIDPATRTFQALRIAVNDELGELHRALDASCDILNKGGVLVVVSFHSLEDSIVKNFLKEKSGEISNSSRYVPEIKKNTQNPIFKIVSRKAIKPSYSEIAENPRSRSARMRIGVRI